MYFPYKTYDYNFSKHIHLFLIKFYSINICSLLFIEMWSFLNWETERDFREEYGTYKVILDGNLEIDAHVRSHLCYLICLRQLNRSRAVTKRILSPKRPFSFMRAHHLVKVLWVITWKSWQVHDVKVEGWITTAAEGEQKNCQMNIRTP